MGRAASGQLEGERLGRLEISSGKNCLSLTLKGPEQAKRVALETLEQSLVGIYAGLTHRPSITATVKVLLTGIKDLKKINCSPVTNY